MIEFNKYKLIIFDVGGTLMEFVDMPLSWADYYEQGFKNVNDKLSLNLSDSDISISVQKLRKFNPRINYRENEINPDIIFSDVTAHWNCSFDLNIVINTFFSGLNLNVDIYEYSLHILKLFRDMGIVIGLLTDLPCGMPDDIFKSSITSLIENSDFYISSQSCGYRKPNKFALELLKNEYKFSDDILIIGDEPKDEQLAKNSGCDFIHINDFRKTIYCRLIASITDKNVLGRNGLSTVAPRFTARAVLKNSEGLYAVMYAEKFNLYSLVGGGIESGESVLQALRREVLEETGCGCDIIRELGIVYENRFHADYTQYSYYFEVTTNGVVASPELTSDEKDNNTQLQWHTFDEVVQLISKPVHKTNQQKFLQARDTAVLEYYSEEKI